MLSELNSFYINQPEPTRSLMLGLRNYIQNYHPDITEKWKYKLPFFYYKGKAFCYIWKDRKTQQVYIGIVKAQLFSHPALFQGNRKKIQVLYLNPDENIPINLSSM